MILAQALVVGGIGYGFGVGLATLFGIVAQCDAATGLFPALASAGHFRSAVFVIALVASLFSIRRVLVLEPAVVFQGGA